MSAVIEEKLKEVVKVVNLRQKGRGCINGKVIKGCVQDAGSKVSIGCIPSTYEAIIYRNNSAQAFGTSSFRFQQNSDFINIAPNQYKKQDASIYRWKSQEGFNRKGYGPFLSKDKRMMNVSARSPGPGNYEIRTSVTTIDTENNSVVKEARLTSSKRQDRFKQKQNIVPGPGEYHTDNVKRNSPGWKSSFESKVKRDKYLQLNTTPGPGAYNSKLPSKPVHKSPVRNTEQHDLQQTIVKLMNVDDADKCEYSYNLPDFQPRYSKIKNSPIFIEGKIDRFGNSNNSPNSSAGFSNNCSPGPGSYKIKSNFVCEKKEAAASYFMSDTTRNVFNAAEDKLGPNSKEVFLLGKKKFHLNVERKWV